jgi:NADH:ubiquinone reductase (H+-translocating)
MRVVIIGGGYVGLNVARKLQRPLARAGHDLLVINPENFMQYHAFLPEAAGGLIEPRHVVVPLRQALRHSNVLVGEVTSIEHDARLAVVRTIAGDEVEVPYDLLILTAGSRSRILPVPGLAERGIGFKNVTEAIHLRNHVLSRLEIAAEATTGEQLTAALTFVFVGAGYAGVEALAELEDLAASAMRLYPTLDRSQMRWILVEAGPAILPEMGGRLSQYVKRHLERRGIEVMVGTRLESAEGGLMRLSNGRAFEADTLVWTTGVTAEPLVGRVGFPTGPAGRVETDECLRVKGVADAWAAGDCAAVPDLATGGITPPTAQHGAFEARRLSKNVLRVLRGKDPKPFRHRNFGMIASLGRFRGVANPLGVRLRGFPAWWLHRTYHLFRMPTIGRKVRILLDWTVGLFFRRDVVQLGSLQRPREPFERATREAGGEP